MESFTNILFHSGLREDSIFFFILFLSAASFVGAELVWMWGQWRRPQPQAKRANLPDDDNRFSALWTIVPALVLVCLVFVNTPKPKQVSQREAPPVKKVSLTPRGS